MEVLDVSRASTVALDEEAQAIATVKEVVPRVEVLAWTGREWVVDHERSRLPT